LRFEMQKKTLKTVTGTLVPKVHAGSGPRDKRMPPREGDRSHYNHPAIAVNEADLQKWQRLRGAPLIFEHGEKQKQRIQVGTMLDSTIQQDGSLYIVASVHDDETGAWAAERIERGDISGFSIGYEVVPDVHGNVAEKRLQEVSLVVKPFFEQAKISVCATSSDGDLYKTDSPQSSVQHVFVPMDSTSNTPPSATSAATAAPVAQQQQPQQQAPRDAAREISQHAAEIELKQMREAQAKEKAAMEEERKKNKEMADELAAYRAEKEAQKRALADTKVKELESALASVQKGLGLAELPKEYVEDVRKLAQGQVYLDEKDPVKRYVDVQASMIGKFGTALASKDEENLKMREQNAKMEREIAELKEMMSKTQKSFDLAAERVAASRDAIYRGAGATPVSAAPTGAAAAPAAPTESVKASGSMAYLHGSEMSDILQVPHVRSNTLFGQIYQKDYNASFGQQYGPYGVHASGVTEEPTMVSVKAPPVHDKLSYVPNSMRFNMDPQGNPSGAAWLSHIIHNFNKDARTSPKFGMRHDPIVYERTF
jgi:hypothetical protein